MKAITVVIAIIIHILQMSVNTQFTIPVSTQRSSPMSADAFRIGYQPIAMTPSMSSSDFAKKMVPVAAPEKVMTSDEFKTHTDPLRNQYVIEYKRQPEPVYNPKAPGNISQRHNNPGNLVLAGQPEAYPGMLRPDNTHFAYFPTVDAGFKALENDIKVKASRGLNLKQFVEIYAPKQENDVKNYLSFLASNLGANAGTPLSAIVNDPKKLTVIRELVARIEGYYAK